MLSTGQMRRPGLAQIAALSTGDIAVLSVEQIAALSAKGKLPASAALQAGALRPSNQMEKLSTGQIAALSSDALKGPDLVQPGCAHARKARGDQLRCHEGTVHGLRGVALDGRDRGARKFGNIRPDQRPDPRAEHRSVQHLFHRPDRIPEFDRPCRVDDRPVADSLDRGSLQSAPASIKGLTTAVFSTLPSSDIAALTTGQVAALRATAGSSP